MMPTLFLLSWNGLQGDAFLCSETLVEVKDTSNLAIKDGLFYSPDMRCENICRECSIFLYRRFLFYLKF